MTKQRNPEVQNYLDLIRHLQERIFRFLGFALGSGIFTPNLESLAGFGSMTTLHKS
jgi:hypothetical protein